MLLPSPRLPWAFSATRLLRHLLLVTLVLVGLLAWQAMRAAEAHRALAERVLLDYTDLAATEVGRRATNVLGTYGFGVAIRGVSRAFSLASSAIPSRSAVEREFAGEATRTAALVGPLFQIVPSYGVFMGDESRFSRDVRRAILEQAKQPAARPAAEYRVIAVPSPPGETRAPVRLFVLSHVIVIGSSSIWQAGFEVDREELGRWFEELVLRDPLLPPVLASRDVARAAVHVAVRAPDGVLVARTPDTPWPKAARTVPRSLADRAENSLDGFVAELAIAPAAADQLVIGGLPSSRIWLLAALLVITLVLTAIAIAQVGREQALVRERQDFVTRTSHELRTPVAQIRMFTDTLLLDRVRTEEERRQSLAAIDRGARRLAHLVDNVMQFARRESRSEGLARAPQDLAALARQATDEFVAMSSPPPRIALDAAAPVWAPIDAEAFRRILVNLLDNAVKYGAPAAPAAAAPAGREALVRVRLTSNPRAGLVRLSVEDQGPGIPAADRERIWQPYFRLDRDRQSSVAGAGIGLSVVHDLLMQHGGSVRVEDVQPSGARIVITLPAAPSQTALSQAAPSQAAPLQAAPRLVTDSTPAEAGPS